MMLLAGHDRSLFKKKLKLLFHFVFECALFFPFLLFCAVWMSLLETKGIKKEENWSNRKMDREQFQAWSWVIWKGHYKYKVLRGCKRKLVVGKGRTLLNTVHFFFFFLGEPTLFHSVSGDRTWPMDSPWCIGQNSDHHGEGGTVSCDFEERGAGLCPQPHPVCHHQWMLEHAKGNAVGFSSWLFSVEGNLKWNWS